MIFQKDTSIIIFNHVMSMMSCHALLNGCSHQCCLDTQATTTTAQIHFDLFDHPISPSDPLDRHLDVVADLIVLAKARCHVSGMGGWVTCYLSMKA